MTCRPSPPEGRWDGGAVGCYRTVRGDGGTAGRGGVCAGEVLGRRTRSRMAARRRVGGRRTEWRGSDLWVAGGRSQSVNKW